VAEQLTLEAFRAKYEIKPGGRGVRAAPKAKPRTLTLDDLLCPPPPCGNLRPEESISVRCYLALLEERRAGRLRCTFTCIPNELPRPNKGGRSIANFAIAVQNKRRAMGRIPGASDWVFTWSRGGWIELKDPGGEMRIRKVQRAKGPAFRHMPSARGELSDEQKVFRAWAIESGALHAVCYSVEEFLDTLRSWGALAPV
jgi:hypothetical protein